MCHFVQEMFCRNTIQLFPYYYRLYMCASLPWFHVVFFHHLMFSLYILVWPLNIFNNFVWSNFLSDLSVLSIFSILFIYYSFHLFIEENYSSHATSPYRWSHRCFSSIIHFHPKEKYCGIGYKRTQPLYFHHYFIEFSL